MDESLDVLLVGLDAACPRVLDPLLDDGAVPALASTFERGASGTLASQVPPWTASAWPSLYTGVNPGKHGVFGFLAFDGYDWDVVDADRVRAWSLPERLDRHGLSSVVVNVPVTHPAPEIDGAVLPGYVAPEDPDCHPDGLLDDVREAVGEYRIYPTLDADGDDRDRDGTGGPAPGGDVDAADTPSTVGTDHDETVAELRRLAGMRGAAFRHLADRFEPDFGFLQFQVTDTVLHEFPGDLAAARRVYEAVDDEVGRVLDACDPDAVVVASDHGMGPYSTRFRVNEFLREEGYVAATRGGDGMPAWSALRDGGLATGDGGDGAGPGVAASALSALARAGARAGLTSQRVGGLLERLGLAEAAMAVVPTDAVRAGSEQVAFQASRAYVRSRVESGVRINLEGREPEGTVSPDEYESVRSELVSTLRAVRTPDGKPVFDRVAPREAFFDGPHVEEAPDVVVVPRGFDVYLTTWLLGDRFEVPDEPTWDHTMTGVVALAGDGVAADADLADAHLLDVAPTVLGLLGVPAGERMDGAALPAVEPPDTEPYPDYRKLAGGDGSDGSGGRDGGAGDEGRSGSGNDGSGGDDADSDVADRLAAMGYLE